MPQVEDETPDSLKPYICHGVDLAWKVGAKEAIGDCPWCGREGKFSVNAATGQWRCFVCLEGNDNGKGTGGGNVYVFLRMLWEKSLEQTTTEDYQKLAADRKLHFDTTPLFWNLAKSYLIDKWLVPGFNTDLKLTGLYRYTWVDERMALLPTTTLGHQLLANPSSYVSSRGTIYLCEGIWDAMALWEILGVTKQTDEGYAQTASQEFNLLADANVLSVPSASTFYESWRPIFGGKRVILMAQNDHERIHPRTGMLVPPASYRGMQRVADMLAKAENPPSEISLLHWGEKGYNLDLPSGYDIRDALTSAP